MKRLHTLGLTLCLLGVFTLSTAQQATAPDNKKVIVIKKQIDANGQQTVEKVIVTNGVEADAVLADMEVEKEVIVVHGNCSEKNVTNIKNCKSANRNIVVNVNEDNGEQVIVINVDGETETLRLQEGEELSQEDKERLAAKGVHLRGDHNALRADEITVYTTKNDSDFDFNFSALSEGLVALGKDMAHIGEFRHAYAYDGGDINCAALGVYVSTDYEKGVYVNSIIGASGAEEAGLKSGDVIRSINDDATTTYGELHDALSKHEPGDVVTVTFSRDGVEDRVETQLRAWKDFPSFANSRHALITCNKDAAVEETVTKKIIVIKKDKVEEPVVPENVNQSPIINSIDNSLVLSDFVAFPNPTDGKFNVQFSAEAVPTVVSVYDAAGKEIFRDNVDNFNGYYNREVDLTSHARGALVLSVEQNGKSFTEQIVLH